MRIYFYSSQKSKKIHENELIIYEMKDNKQIPIFIISVKDDYLVAKNIGNYVIMEWDDHYHVDSEQEHSFEIELINTDHYLLNCEDYQFECKNHYLGFQGYYSNCGITFFRDYEYKCQRHETVFKMFKGHYLDHIVTSNEKTDSEFYSIMKEKIQKTEEIIESNKKIIEPHSFFDRKKE